VEEADRLAHEAEYLRRAALVAAERHFAAETRWFHSSYWIGLPAAVLSSLASAAAFQEGGEWHNLAGFIALGVAVLSALSAFLDPKARAQQHHAAAKAFEALYYRIGLYDRLRRPSEAEIEAAKAQLASFTEEYVQLRAQSPAIPGYAYTRADRNLKQGWGEVSRHPADQDYAPPTRPGKRWFTRRAYIAPGAENPI